MGENKTTGNKVDDSEFDFDVMAAKFQKLSTEDSSQAKDQKLGSYNKNNFFDSISNSTTEKTRESREERAQHNAVDCDTFSD